MFIIKAIHPKMGTYYWSGARWVPQRERAIVYDNHEVALKWWKAFQRMTHSEMAKLAEISEA